MMSVKYEKRPRFYENRSHLNVIYTLNLQNLNGNFRNLGK
jgi:hypothetical protein